jgi:hypothetical protein
MSQKMIPLFTVLALGIGGAVQAQTTVPIDTSGLTVKTPNPNIVKVDGTLLGTDVKAISNPAQINIKVKAPDGGKAMVKLPADATSIDDATKVKIKLPK